PDHDIGSALAHLDLVHDDAGMDRGGLAGDIAHSRSVVQDGKKQLTSYGHRGEDSDASGRLDEIPIGAFGDKPIEKTGAGRHGSGPKNEDGNHSLDRSFHGRIGLSMGRELGLPALSWVPA